MARRKAGIRSPRGEHAVPGAGGLLASFEQADDRMEAVLEQLGDRLHDAEGKPDPKLLSSSDRHILHVAARRRERSRRKLKWGVFASKNRGRR